MLRLLSGMRSAVRGHCRRSSAPYRSRLIALERCTSAAGWARRPYSSISSTYRCHTAVLHGGPCSSHSRSGSSTQCRACAATLLGGFASPPMADVRSALPKCGVATYAAPSGGRRGLSMAAPSFLRRNEEDDDEEEEEEDEEDGLLDDTVNVVRTRHGRPSKKAGKREAVAHAVAAQRLAAQLQLAAAEEVPRSKANKQLAAAQQLVALSPGRLRPLWPDLDERIADALALARSMKRSKGLQRQIGLVAKLLRDEVDPVTLEALQNRIAAAAAGKESGGGASAAEKLALAWRAALTGEAVSQQPSGGGGGGQGAEAAVTGEKAANDGPGALDPAAAAAAEAEVMAAAAAMLTATGRVAGGHYVELTELRQLIRQAREEQEAGMPGGKPKSRGRSRAGRRLLAELRPLAAKALAGGTPQRR